MQAHKRGGRVQPADANPEAFEKVVAVAGAWQGDRGPSVCLPWCVRALSATTTTRSLVETILRAAALSGDATLAHDATGTPYFCLLYTSPSPRD